MCVNHEDFSESKTRLGFSSEECLIACFLLMPHECYMMDGFGREAFCLLPTFNIRITKEKDIFIFILMCIKIIVRYYYVNI